MRVPGEVFMLNFTKSIFAALAWNRQALPELSVVAGMSFLCMSLLAQGSTGGISGTVTDESGGVVPGATVTVTDTQRGISRSLTADASGAFAAPNLTPGIYTVRGEFKGFKATERQKIQVEVGEDLRVDLPLQPGEESQAVTVTEPIPLIETTNAELGG